MLPAAVEDREGLTADTGPVLSLLLAAASATEGREAAAFMSCMLLGVLLGGLPAPGAGEGVHGEAACFWAAERMSLYSWQPPCALQ